MALIANFGFKRLCNSLGKVIRTPKEFNIEAFFKINSSNSSFDRVNSFLAKSVFICGRYRVIGEINFNNSFELSFFISSQNNSFSPSLWV